MKHRSLVVGLLLFALAIPFAGHSQEAAKAAPDPVKFDASDTVSSNLGKHIGDKVEVVLNSGQSLKGTIKKVGAHSVHLNALEGREYFDAVVRLDQIQAVVIRAKQG